MNSILQQMTLAFIFTESVVEQQNWISEALQTKS